MDNRTERLKKFDNNKLIDVVKNYRQYGYDEEIRNTAIEILESRGIDMEILRLRGDFKNKIYDDAETYLHSFEKSSKMAFIFYGLLIITKIIIPLIARAEGKFQMYVVVLFWISLVTYIICLLKSFIDQSSYYKLVGKKENQLNPLLYFTVGMFLYMIMYFIFRKQMKADINLIK